MVLSSHPKPSYPAGVTTEENWAFWAKAWWAFTGMWQQRRTFSPYGEHKGLAWLLFLHASWGTVPIVPQKTRLLYHLSLCIVPTQLHWHGKKLLGIFCAAQHGEMSCPHTSCLLGCEAVPDAITRLLLTQTSWLAVVSQAATEMTTTDDRALEKWDWGHQLRAPNPNWLPVYLFIYFWRGREGRRSATLAESLTSDWLLRPLKA